MKIKFKVILIILIVLTSFILVDVFRMTQVEITVADITPDPAPAVSTSPVKISVSAKYKSGKPVVDHTLYALSLGGGSWESYYVKTDENGNAEFTYYPYDLPSYQQPRDVKIKIRDESNSIFVEMYPTLACSISLTRPGDTQSNSGTVDNFLD